MVRRLVGLKEMARYLRRGVRTVRRYIRERGFPAVLVGGTWEADVADVEVWRRK